MNMTGCSEPVLSTDMATWIRWMDEAVRKEEGGNNLSYRNIRFDVFDAATDAEGGSNTQVCIPMDSCFLDVMAFVEAERHNAHSGFIREFASQAIELGHAVTFERVKRVAVEKPETKQQTIALMLSVAPVESQEELDAIKGRIMSNEATDVDKWRHYTESYKRSWGIDRLDEMFLEANGTDAGRNAAKMMARVLCPELRRNANDDISVAEKSAIMKVVIADEVVKGLGLKSPLDCETEIKDLKALYDTSLCHLDIFKEYNKYSSLFRDGSGGVEGTWCMNKISKAINMILHFIGVRLEGKTKQTTKKQKEEGQPARITITTHKLVVGDMTELLKLRLRGSGCVPENDHARKALEECQMTKYGHLVDPEKESVHKEFAFISDEE